MEKGNLKVNGIWEEIKHSRLEDRKK